jgi:hypothetical protein
VKELTRRLRGLPVADAVGLAGLGMLLVGVAVTVEALIEAARSTPNASLLDWYDRLGLGLLGVPDRAHGVVHGGAAGAVVGPGTG